MFERLLKDQRAWWLWLSNIAPPPPPKRDREVPPVTAR